MPIKNRSSLILPLLFYLFTLLQPFLIQCGSYSSMITPGTWVILQDSIGISAMHMQVLKNNKVIMFDRTDFGQSNLSLPNGKCRYNDEAVKPKDCTAHSVLYDVASNTFRPLMILTNTWCSSGSLDSEGTLVQTGGDKRGERVIRKFIPCDDESCDWLELTSPLFNRRWYASNQLLPDGRIIIVGGRRVFTYEFYPKSDFSLKPDNRTLPFLLQTRDPKEENNLYPFLHLLPDGNLFIFANNRSILLDYRSHVVLKEFPVMPGGGRSYPSTGSSVLLPIQENTNTNSVTQVEVLICGGSPPGAHIKAVEENVYVEALRTCGRLRLDDPNATWVMEQMPSPRVMNDMLLLPTGDVIIINGAANGTAGWEDATNAVLNPVLYIPNEEPNRRFFVLKPSKTPRMYHSTAALLADGRILVGGSNPHPTYNFTSSYPTELSLEAFQPHYLDPQYVHLRPSILTVETVERSLEYNEMFGVTLMLSVFHLEAGVSVVIIAPSFTTHSFAMGQRMVVLNVVSVGQLSMFAYKVNVIGPSSVNVAPPGYYMMFVVHGGIPSHAVWVKVG